VSLPINEVDSQVYFSTYEESRIYVGPNNVLTSFEGMKRHYCEFFEIEIAQLENINNQRVDLASQAKLSRKEKRKLKKLNLSQEDLERDIENLKVLEALWKSTETFEPKILENNCFTYGNSLKIYQSQDLKLIISKNESAINQIEFVPLIDNPTADPRWVKIKTPNGQEVWCLVDGKGYFTDITGRVIDFHEKEKIMNATYSYSDSSKRLLSKTMIEHSPASNSYQMKIKENNLMIPIAQLKVSDCE